MAVGEGLMGLMGEEAKAEMEAFIRGQNILEEREMMKALAQCELFKKYVKQRYILQVFPCDGDFTRLHRLVRKKDNKVLGEWKR